MIADAGQYDLSQQVLRTDVAGMPLEWIDYRDAVRLYHTEQVAYSCGTPLFQIFGGTNALTGNCAVPSRSIRSLPRLGARTVLPSCAPATRRP